MSNDFQHQDFGVLKSYYERAMTKSNRYLSWISGVLVSITLTACSQPTLKTKSVALFDRPQLSAQWKLRRESPNAFHFIHLERHSSISIQSNCPGSRDSENPKVIHPLFSIRQSFRSPIGRHTEGEFLIEEKSFYVHRLLTRKNGCEIELALVSEPSTFMESKTEFQTMIRSFLESSR